jgi:arylsulfatase A-like enzyme
MPFRAGLHIIAAMAAIALAPALVSAADRPNIVVVVVDGLGDLATPLGGANEILPDPEIRARLTPNLDRLAKLGTTFACAQAVDTAKTPDILSLGKEGESLPVLLKQAGYETAATGLRSKASKGWDEVRPYEQNAVKLARWEMEPDLLRFGGEPGIKWRRFIPTTERRKDDLSIEAWERLTQSLDDQLAAAWAADRIAKKEADAEPQFAYVELPSPAIPHQMWEAPGIFFDRFPLDQIVVPKIDPDDFKDLPEGRPKFGVIHAPFGIDEWPVMLQAYLAAISATDYAIGKVVDAVEAVNNDEDESNDWVLVVVSKRGFQFGLKGTWGFSPWEDSTRSNLMIYAPEVTTPEQRIDTPVSVGDVAPTVAALAGMELSQPIVGGDLLPLMSTKGGWPGAVAMTTVQGAAKSLRSQRFRLIRYGDGSEDLYDHDHDAEEAYNLLDPQHGETVKKFGMSDTQVEAVRKWLGDRLNEQVALRIAPALKPKSTANLPGDFNNDGSVDAADSTVWRDNLGKEVPVGTQGDGDFDGRVEEDDRNVWLNNYGRKREPTAAE